MIKLGLEDYASLEDFLVLPYRADSKDQKLPEADLKQVHPLKNQKARELWEYASPYLVELAKLVFVNTDEDPLTSSLYQWVRRIDMNSLGWSVGCDVVQQTFSSWNMREDQVVLVMWGPEEAMSVPWKIFSPYWDTFCRIALEDVGIFPISEEWYLLYSHEDQMIFGKPRLPLLDEASRKPPEPRPLIHKDEVIRLLKANERIAAMKLYHQETGVGYKRASDAIKMLEEELRQSSD